MNNTAAVVVEKESGPIRKIAVTTTPSDLLRLAIEQGADLDRLEKLMNLQERWEKDQARKAYVAAMASFKAEPLVIGKDKHVKFVTAKGTTEYDHATIGNVTRVICAALGRHGFSHRWDADQQDGGRIVVTCVITHELGHSETTTLKASPDDSGGKNNIQSIASTVTYLQRYTLLAATGMATSDQEDDDGRGSQAARPDYMDDEYTDWRSHVDACATPEDFARVWKDMTPAVRFILAPYVKERKEQAVSA